MLSLPLGTEAEISWTPLQQELKTNNLICLSQLQGPCLSLVKAMETKRKYTNLLVQYTVKMPPRAVIKAIC